MTTEAPLFSIITPTFNCKSKIASTIQSVLDQSYDNFEYLLVDGKSSDGTQQYLAGIQDPRVCLFSELDKGIYDAMNKGIRSANGRFIYFLGAGDRLRPNTLNFISNRIAKLDSDGVLNPVLIYGNVAWGTDGRIHAGEFSRRKLLFSNICHQSIFYEARIFGQIGSYNTRYIYCADHLMNIRCWSERHIRKVYVDFIVADYEAEGGSSSNSDVTFIKDFPKIISNYFGFTYAAWFHLLRLTQGFKSFASRTLRRRRGVAPCLI